MLVKQNPSYIMKKTFITTFSLLFSFGITLYSQSTFQKTISNPDDQVINQVIENDEGGFVLVGRIYQSDTSGPGGYILKIDSTGNLLKEEIIQPIDTINYIFFNVHFFNNHYYILGSQMIIYPDTTKLWYLQLNSELEIENEKLLSIPAKRWFSYMIQ